MRPLARLAPWIVPALGWAAAAATVCGLHPALHGEGPLAREGRELAIEAARGHELLRLLGSFDAMAPIAFMALAVSVIYIGAWAHWRVTRIEEASRSWADARSSVIVGAALIGHVAGTVAVSLKGDVTSFYCWMAGTAGVLLVARRFAGGDPEIFAVRPRPMRLVGAAVLGLLLILLCGLLDTAIAARTGARQFPEAWYPLVVDFGVRYRVPMAVALSGLLALAAAGLSLGRAHWLIMAPAYILVLGPSSPVKGLMTAWIVESLGRGGGGRIARAGFVWASIAMFVAIAFAMR